MVKFLVVRHGYSLSNKEKTFTGQLDIDLSEEGYVQAQLVSDYILENYKVDEIYSSDLQRAYHTVEKVAKTLGKEIHMEKDLREMRCGKWEGVAVSEVEKLFPEDFGKWKGFSAQMRCTGGESMKELRSRAAAVFDRIARENEGKTVVVATHGGVIRTMQTVWKGIKDDDWASTTWANNASITTVIYDGENSQMIEDGLDEFLGKLKTEVPKGM